MRRFLGLLLVVAAAGLAYGFGRLTPPAEAHQSWLAAPFLQLGRSFPMDACVLLTALWCLGMGLYYLLRAPDSRPAPVGQVFLVHTLLLASFLVLAFAGTRGEAARLGQIFAALAGLGIVAGLFLFLLAATERPAGKASLAVGGALYLATAAVGVFVFLQGRA